MSRTRSIQNISKGVNVSRPAKIIGELFDYYKGREYALVQLLYKKGATQKEIADCLGVDPALISRNFPRSKK